MDMKTLIQRARDLISSGDKMDSLDDADMNWEGTTVSMLLGSGKRAARLRSDIYAKYHYMAGDPVISTALRLHVTHALGGHETSGEVIFIEKSAKASPEAAKYADAIRKDLAPLFNRIAHQAAFNGCVFGDSYARVYAKDGRGVMDVYTDELVHPPLVQPYEQGNRTVGYTITSGQKFTEKLTVRQMARLKMPRMLYVPQNKVIEKSMRTAIREDDIDKLPILPALVGGSFLDAAEEPYDNLIAALTGLVGQRVLNSINESMIGVNMESMTKEQREKFMASLRKMLTDSKARAEQAVREGKPLLERLYHIMPTFGEKQMTRVDGFNSQQGGNNITIEDVMLHARMLSGALGIDLSMLGFADQMAGGLGDGGFFRVSAHAAERARVLRGALTDFFNAIADLHTYSKWGFVFKDGERPYTVNFYGSNSALALEQERNRESAFNTGLALTQLLGNLRDLQSSEGMTTHVLSKVATLDEAAAKSLAEGIAAAR